MARAGFVACSAVEVAQSYELEDIQPYQDRAFSSLLLIDDEAFARGIARLEAELARGPIPSLSLYTLVWGTRPERESSQAT